MKTRIDRLIAYFVLVVMIGQTLLPTSLTVWAETSQSSTSDTASSDSLLPAESEEVVPSSSSSSFDQTSTSLSSTENADTDQTLTGLSQEGVKESSPSLPSHLLAILPLDADGDILRSTYQQGYDQVALIGKDGSVSKVAVTNETRYQPLNSQAHQQYEQIRSEFEAVKFEDLYEYLVPAYQSSIERLRIQTELQKTLGRTPTATEVDTALRAYYIERLDLRSAFEEVKLQLPWLLTGILERTPSVDLNQVVAQKKRILLGLTYLERQYSFEFENISAKRLLLFYPEVFGTPARTNPLERIIAIGQVTYADLELLNAEKTFEKILSGYSQNRSLQGWIDTTVARFVPYQDAASWFSLTSPAHIVETDSYHAETRIYEKMRTDDRLRKHLIALLNVSPDSIFAISTMSSVNYGLVQTYVSQGDSGAIPAFKELLETIAQQQEDFFATWVRITGKTQELATANILVIDSLRHYGTQYQSARDLWSAATGPTANIGVKEFFTPLSLYRPYQQVGAEAAPTSRSFTNFMVKSLTQSGQETFTHEVTHILDKSIYFNGQDRRTGQLAEVYARGLFESIDNSIGVSSYKPVFNLNLSYELGDKRTQNASSTRFQTAADLQTYMQGVMDVLYTLDYAEAKASLGKSAEDKALLYHQMTLVPDTNVAKRGANQVKDQIQPISSTQASQLTSLNHLIENGMVSSRFTFQGTTGTGVVEPNSYYVIQLFNPIYAAMQNNPGSVGELSFKRNAYELLAEYGYQNGMVAYISNQHGGSDQAALNAIFGNQYQGQMVEFKKAMFQRRIDKTPHLKAVDGIQSFQDLEALMQAAVDKDLAKMKQNKANNRPQLEGVTAVENLKLRVYQGYLKLTNDFTDSIYKPILATKTEESIVPIPIQRIEQPKADLWEGESQEVIGAEGSKKVVKTWQTQDGVIVGEPQITETELTPMRPTMVYRGTKPVNGEIVTSQIVPIPIETEYRTDSALEEGKTRTVEGKAGSKRVITTQPTYKGQAQGQATIREEQITPMVKTIVYQGIKPIAKYRVVYQFSSQDANRILPIKVMEQLPKDTNLYAKAQPVTAQQPTLTSITVADGTWNFAGYQVDKQLVGEEDVTFIGQWTFTAKPVVDIKVEETVVIIPIQVIEKDKADLWQGEKQEVLGKEGKKRVTKTWKTVDGIPSGLPIISEIEISPMEPTIIYNGTKPVNGEEVTTKVVIIPIKTEYRTDSTLDEGKTRTVQGQAGSKRIITTQPTYKGQPTGQASVKEEPIKDMVPTVIYKGTKSNTKYRVKYRFTSKDGKRTLPAEVQKLLPQEEGGYTTGQMVTAKNPSKRTVAVADGTWTFDGYKINKQTVKSADLVFEGIWFFSAKASQPIPSPSSLKPVYRLYHEGLQVHLYTTDTNELAVLKKRGDWRYEGISWKTETTKGDPVYRLYHPTIKVHLYTRDKNEYTVLAQRGWNQEGVAYRSYGPVPIYRLYHSGLKKHLYTRDTNERDILKTRGWNYEGIAWYSQP